MGYQVRTVALSPGTSDNQLPVAALGSRPYGIGTLRSLRAALRAVDVTIAHGSKTLFAVVAAGGRGQNPFIYRNIGDSWYWARTPLRRWRVRVAMRRAAAIASVWPGAARHLSQHFGVPARKIVVIPNGRPPERYGPPDARQRQAARARLIQEPSGPIAICLGALSPEKRVDLAIEAVAELTDIHLVVAGDGPERARLEALARRIAPGRVEFCGSVADSAEVLAAADVLVLASETEGLPGVLVEAGMVGVPVVATAVGGVPEVVIPGRTGVLVPPGDALAIQKGITEALASRERYGQAARDHCLRNFDIHTTSVHWDRLLRDVAARHAGVAL